VRCHSATVPRAEPEAARTALFTELQTVTRAASTRSAVQAVSAHPRTVLESVGALASRVMELSEHARRNRAAWDEAAAEYVESGRRHWAQDASSWGIWEIREEQLGVLGDVADLDVVELGCGTAYWSAWLARRGARPTGVDLSEAQLATARDLQAEHGLEFPLVHASAEAVPLTDASYDLALSEYGASLWCEPAAWIGEAARLLRPRGRLVFLTNSLLIAMCAPDDGAAGDRLLRPQRDLQRLEWPGEEGVEFHLAHGEWIAVLRAGGFVVEALHELYAPEGARPTRFRWVTPEWARRWPYEEIWVARREA
jgi:SAM-dependent methyltransferase